MKEKAPNNARWDPTNALKNTIVLQYEEGRIVTELGTGPFNEEKRSKEVDIEETEKWEKGTFEKRSPHRFDWDFIAPYRVKRN